MVGKTALRLDFLHVETTPSVGGRALHKRWSGCGIRGTQHLNPWWDWTWLPCSFPRRSWRRTLRGVNTSPSSVSKLASRQPLLTAQATAGGSGKAGRALGGRAMARGPGSRGRGWGSLWTACSSSSRFLVSGRPVYPAVNEASLGSW